MQSVTCVFVMKGRMSARNGDRRFFQDLALGMGQSDFRNDPRIGLVVAALGDARLAGREGPFASFQMVRAVVVGLFEGYHRARGFVGQGLG